MKKEHLKLSFFCAVALLGIASFVYLNTLDANSFSQKSCNTTVERNTDEQGARRNYKLILPDVELMKKLISASGRIVPST